jgi:1-acyl-sn-glycerol-3-phosphate acyltransferase
VKESDGALRGAKRLARIAGLVALTLARAARVPGRSEGAWGRTALLAEAARRALAIHGLDVRVSGPVPRGPALLVSNHLSYLDPLVLLSRAACVPISKSELASWPLLGAVARRTGVLFVERSSAGSRLTVMRAAERVFRDGGIVLNFPEGTTTDGSTVLRFRKGLFGVVQALGVPVVPVALRYQPRELAWIGDAAFVPHYLRFVRLERSLVDVAFGDPIPSQAHPSGERLADAARACTLSLLEDGDAWLRKAR